MLFFRNRLFDGVSARRRGMTALGWPKPKLKFELAGKVRLLACVRRVIGQASSHTQLSGWLHAPNLAQRLEASIARPCLFVCRGGGSATPALATRIGCSAIPGAHAVLPFPPPPIAQDMVPAEGSPAVREFGLQSFWYELGERSYMKEPLALQVSHAMPCPHARACLACMATDGAALYT